MKHFLLVIAITVGLSVKAQDKAIDYYYPEGVTQFIDIGSLPDLTNMNQLWKHSKEGGIANFEFVHNHWGGNSNLSEEMLFYDKRHGRYTSIGDKNNWIIEISANRIKENGKIVLILPDVGKVEKWNKLEFRHSTNYEARLVTINVCIGGQWQDINAIAVKNSLFSIDYWAKGYGLL